MLCSKVFKFRDIFHFPKDQTSLSSPRQPEVRTHRLCSLIDLTLNLVVVFPGALLCEEYCSDRGNAISPRAGLLNLCTPDIWIG